MEIEIIDYQYSYAEKSLYGTKVIIDDVEILDVDDDIENDVDLRVQILDAVLKHLKIDANVDASLDFD